MRFAKKHFQRKIVMARHQESAPRYADAIKVHFAGSASSISILLRRETLFSIELATRLKRIHSIQPLIAMNQNVRCNASMGMEPRRLQSLLHCLILRNGARIHQL
ncbi:MAG: hypothetical protein EBR82_85310 [Caulobacteraceae bacterium]|nr:hypothetical protein [Caulobacteraceae bacterium]